MCGIIAALAYGEFEDKKVEKVRQESMIFLASELLQLTQPRGKDATGIATLFANCDYMGLKMGVSAQEFVSRFGGTEKDYEGYLNIWRKKTAPAKIVIGHCRKPSVGAGSVTDDNNNNHPIKIGDIVGVHNGTIANHENIITNLKCTRDGKVDSEAIIQLLNHYTKGSTEPFTKEGILETCKRLEGTYACMAFNGNNPYQMAAFRDGRPLEIAILRSLKLVLIASEKDFIKSAVYRYGKMAYLYNTGGVRFMPLTQSDFDVETLPDDSLFLFDIRDEITEDTKITDLYITEKVPRTNKLWHNAVTTTRTWNNAGYNTYSPPPAKTVETSAAVVKTVEEKKTTCGTATTGATATSISNDRSGMVWNRSSRKYEPMVSNVDASTKEHGNVEINVEKGGEVKDVGNEGKVLAEGEKKTTESTSPGGVQTTPRSPFQLVETDKPVDDLITNHAKVIEITAKIAEKKPTVTSKEVVVVNNPAVTKKEVDLKAYPDVVERAKIETKKEPNFNSYDELADAIEVSDVSSMRTMSLYALANRIKSFFFRLGWEKGYIARLNEEDAPDNSEFARTMLVRIREKANNAKTTIRTMKSITRILSNIATDGVGGIPERKVDKAVAEVLSAGEKIDIESLKKAYREGDMKKDPVLRVIASTIENKQGR